MVLKFRSKLKYKAMIDVTSLIDLVFLLVAFFMVTSSLGSESSITVHLPKAVQSGEHEYGATIVSITEKNEIYINDKKIQNDQLLDEFKQRKEKLKDASIVIRGDRSANYETIVNVMDNLNRAGIPKFTLSTTK